jgi:hypothetical protein
MIGVPSLCCPAILSATPHPAFTKVNLTNVEGSVICAIYWLIRPNIGRRIKSEGQQKGLPVGSPFAISLSSSL